MLLIDLFTTLYRPLRLRGRSPETTRLYHCTLRAFGRWLGREPELRDLDELVMARYLEARAGQVAPLTAEKERSQLCALAALAWERRLIHTKPSCPPATVPDRIPTAWSVDELRRLLTAASDPRTYGRVAPAEARRRAAFFGGLLPVAYETAERIGAILAALIEDYRRPMLIVRAEARKGRRRDRIYKLTEGTCDRVEALIAGRTSGLVFEWQLATTYIHNAFHRIASAAGLEQRRRLGFHDIRRSAASHFAAAGGDAVAMLDHSSGATTRRWYLDPRLADRGVRPCDVLPPIFHPSWDEEYAQEPLPAAAPDVDATADEKPPACSQRMLFTA